MMKEQSDSQISDHVGLSYEKYDSLSIPGKAIYNMLFDYCTYSDDPHYKTLHKFRNKISNLEPGDRDILISYFNSDPAIKWNGMSSEPWEYYKDPY